MTNTPLIIGGKVLSKTFKTLNLGNGSTWPGHLALKANKEFISQVLAQSKTKIIIVAGTNGKTTTTKLLQTILEKNNKSVLHNKSGANLLNGLASAILLHANASGELTQDFAIFEVDENALPLVLEEITPDYLVLLNLFRDQLDRYGEVNTVAHKWQEAIAHLPQTTTLVLNADDPQIAYLGAPAKSPVKYFGLDNKSLSQNRTDHAVDSTYCPQCGNKLLYSFTFFSHLGAWKCPQCHLERPKITLSDASHFPLPGIYNRYNSLAAYIVAESLGISEKDTILASKHFTPAFGRQEKIVLNDHEIHLFLSKNPTGFNVSLRTVKELGGKTLLLVLNDRIPDGTDVSWIWDIEMEEILTGDEHFFVSGDRVYDMALRLKYAGISPENMHAIPDLKEAIAESVKSLQGNETLYVLPTYSAMLETRKILTGRHIL